MKFLTSILVVVILLITNSIAAQTDTIAGTIANVTSDEGNVGLHNQTNFKMQQIQGMESNIVVEENAIIRYHDINNNDKIDFNLMKRL